jgi:hypothetical protein
MKPTGMCLRVVLGMGETNCDIAGNLCRHHIYSIRDLVVAFEVTVTHSVHVGKQGKSNMNYGVPCDPIPAADVEGFRFYRDQNGDVVARCVLCSVGFAIREERRSDTAADGYAS